MKNNIKTKVFEFFSFPSACVYQNSNWDSICKRLAPLELSGAAISCNVYRCCSWW